MTCSSRQAQIAAYVDSELSEQALAELETHFRSCPSCAADALGRLQMKRLTQAAGSRYSPSPEFRLRVERSIQPKRRRLWAGLGIPKLTVAVAAAAALVLFAVLWVRHDERSRGLTELADLHVATLASANPVDVVSSDRHTVKPWFAGKLPFTFNLPELQNSPFKLIGGRMVYIDQSPGAQLLFQIRQHHLSVFILQDKSGVFPFIAGKATARKLNFNVEIWTEGGLRYAIISDTTSADVHQLGELLRQASRS
jgi:anti-sigma factor RsiW